MPDGYRGEVLITGARIVPLPAVPGARPGPPAPAGPVDLRVVDGRVAEVGQGLARTGEVLDAGGAWLIPGLWDQHVHLGQWGLTLGRVDLAGTRSPDEALARVRAALDAGHEGPLWGAGYRLAAWDRSPTVTELDAVVGDRVVVLVGGDYHNAWLSSAALRLAGLADRDVVVEETTWFETSSRLEAATSDPEAVERGVAEAVRRANAMGVTGVRDFDFGPSFEVWPRRVRAGVDTLRAVVSAWPDTLERAAGLRTGDVLDEAGLVGMGPLKIITDGSLGTLTALTSRPYGDPPGYGTRNYEPERLRGLVATAHARGLAVALHAIGDQAVAEVLDAIESVGARGSVEHAQMLRDGQAKRFARLGVAASVQPAHLLDDRDPTLRLWPDDADRVYAFRTLLDAGVPLMLGSDAPVSPLDPWLTLAAAVHRSADEREPWNPAEGLTAGEALACSTNGAGTVGVGSRADLVLLGADPLAGGSTAEQAAWLRAMPVHATVVAGRVAHA